MQIKINCIFLPNILYSEVEEEVDYNYTIFFISQANMLDNLLYISFYLRNYCQINAFSNFIASN